MYGPNGLFSLSETNNPVEKPIADFFKRKIEGKKFVDDPEGGVEPVVESYFKKVFEKRQK